MAHTDYQRAENMGLTQPDRWSEGIDHHKNSIRLMRFLKEHDNNEWNRFFDWRTGGDGDNGEHLMYQMDAFFEMIEEKKVKL